ncbi:pantetheine-phosphate adenylyltransferase [uncultured Muribaculum sp.]|jgi:pantetheine-phosphate adenylyltransferase|uniref:pantetheine-phosphate adenylyltransferase n=1 Tax=uncultured Muribaculum sp. TaxID=1918613 RepID=UPI00263BD2AE|nr:pantetheine-phosphate adenylyltransferase [uncultured Muribaculum sp.]
MTHKSADRTALFAGSFDPYTIGHHSLVERALPLFDRIIIAIGENSGKSSSLSVNERINRISELYAGNSKIKVISYNGLTVDTCKAEGAKWLLRGVRSVADFEYERNLADINRKISGIETVILFTLPEHACVSSSIVRELAHYGYDTEPFLP